MVLNYDYDESSETWPFFLITVGSAILIPFTISHFLSLFKKDADYFENIQQTYKDNKELLNLSKEIQDLNNEYTDADMQKLRSKYESKQKRSKIFNWKTYVLAASWMLMAYLIQSTLSNKSIFEKAAKELFDPYEMLGLASSSTDKEIRSAYRKLSVRLHPDKMPKNLSDMEKLKFEEDYVLITKAYKALTDELTKENYLKYGHPDGPQSVSHGIALPKFLVDSSASPYILAIYIGILAFILPYFVNKWWTSSKLYTKTGIHVESASFFISKVFNYKPSEIVTVDTILHWLSHAEEYKILYPEHSPETFYQLLKNHIERKPNGSKQLDDISFRVVAKTHSLLYSLLNISTVFRNVDITLKLLETFKSIVQAVDSSRSKHELLQLPNVGELPDTKTLENPQLGSVKTLGKLFTLSEDDKAKVLGLDKKSKEFKDAMKVASDIPQLLLLRAKFVVPGEKVVTPGSLPHIDLKVLVRSPKSKFISGEIFPEDKINYYHDDFENLKDPFQKIAEQPIVPQTFAPRFPVLRHSTYATLVINQTDNKIIQTPSKTNNLHFENIKNEAILSQFDKYLTKDVKLDKENFKADEWKVSTIKIPFGQPAPQEKGITFYRIVVSNTDYFGGDLDFTMPMEVKDLPPLTEAEKLEIEMQEVYESESESDDDDDDEKDEHGSDYDSESDFTDIDTDTEGEEE